ncbi:MAG TPA: SURF1 family protein [Trueperaceae bacterium]|nr:SURF1 family protein [Trueperaceae bacterium]
MRHPLLGPRWIAGHLLALALVVLFVNLGFWQLRRLEQRRETVQLVAERVQLAPAALGEVLGAGELPEHRPVTAVGTFDPAQEVLVRGRSLQGQPGYVVLTPLVLAGGSLAGSAVLVERGWVPYQHDSVPVTAAPPPEGEVTVTGRLRAPTSRREGTIGPRDPAEGELVQTFYVDVDRLQPQMPYPLVRAYVELTAVTPPHPGELPLPLPEPELDLGPHLGYAVQWFSFAAIGVVGYFFLMRHVVRGERRAGQAG